jgi:TonB family protein
MPEFPGGGNHAMVAWIVANLKYPAEAYKGKIAGKVLVNFNVSNTGKIRNVKVSKSVHPLLDAEAIRVISIMPDWKPATQGGKPVDVQYMVPVEFKL